MNLKTFYGRTMAEALSEVKRQFGPHAVILNTRTVSGTGLLGLGEKPRTEITAAPPAAHLPDTKRQPMLEQRSRRTLCADGDAKQVPPPKEDGNTSDSQALLSEVGALRSIVMGLVEETRRDRAAKMPSELYEYYCRLSKAEIADEIAQRLLQEVRDALDEEQLRNPKAVRIKLAKAVAAMLPMAGPIRVARTNAPTIIALVGPTGVGKTTTVAKLAANLCLREHRRVGLITIDTYRIAAVEQLKTYAQIIDVPLEVVMTPDQLKEAVARMSDRDVILIDTAGRSQRDVCKIKELRSFFDVVKLDEVHLVLASNCAESVLLETIKQFKSTGVNRVIFTKLDEALGFGVMLACLEQANAQLSYVTTGQAVPDDIEVGQRTAMVQLVLGGRRMLPKVSKSARAKHKTEASSEDAEKRPQRISQPAARQ